MAVGCCVQAGFTLAFMAFLSWRLMLTCFVLVPSIVVLSKWFGGFIRKLSKATQKSLAKANSAAEEAVSSMRTVKAFAAEEEEQWRYGCGEGGGSEAEEVDVYS